MDKQTIKLAEQVGQFLIPTIKELVAAMYAKSNMETLSKFAEMLTAVHEARRAFEDEAKRQAETLASFKAALDAMKSESESSRKELAVSLEQFQARTAGELSGMVQTATFKTAFLDVVELSTRMVEFEEKVEEQIAALPKFIPAPTVDRSLIADEVAAAVAAAKLPTADEVAAACEPTLKALVAKIELPVPTVDRSLVADEVAAAVKAIELPKPADPPTADEVAAACEPTLKALVAKIELPVPTVDRSLVADEVAAAVKAIELPKPADPPTADEVAAACEPALKALVAKIELPVPTVDRSLVADEVAAAVKAAPLPTADEVAAACEPALKALVAKIELPVPTVDRSLVADEVAAAVKAAPLPTAAEVAISCQPMLEAMVAKIELPVPTVDRSLIADEVAAAVKAIEIPTPKDGRDGVDGKDGVLPAVEQYVSGAVYERAAVVRHAGGTWQAVCRTTEPPAAGAADWRALAAGIVGLKLVVGDDGRRLTVKAVLSDGSEVSESTEVPTLIYRGTYEEDRQYVKGDVVTRHGCLWAAEQNVCGVAPKEDSKDAPNWRMIVKAGRDGRAGKDGVDGVQFQAGYAGEYVESKVYPKNSLVEYAGSVWLSKRPTKERPPYMTTNEGDDNWLRVR